MWKCKVIRKEFNPDKIDHSIIGAYTLLDLLDILKQAGYLDETRTIELHMYREE